jgi:hypothetical protein
MRFLIDLISLSTRKRLSTGLVQSVKQKDSASQATGTNVDDAVVNSPRKSARGDARKLNTPQ